MNISLLCGLDEAGRGPLAGPVAAASVILPADFPVEMLNDSKKMSEKKRIEVEKIIKERACWGVALVDHVIIDEINILQASLLAMEQAFSKMLEKLSSFCEQEFGSNIIPNISAIVDGNKCPNLKIPCEAKPKADATFYEVMAASILAMNERDRVMIEYSKLYPEYGYEKHKGYPTKEHKEICYRIGPSPIQRKTFKF